MSTAPATGTATAVAAPAVGVAPGERRGSASNEPGAFVAALATLLAPGTGQTGPSASSGAPTKLSGHAPGTDTEVPADAGVPLAQAWSPAPLPVGAAPTETGATREGGVAKHDATAGVLGSLAVVVPGAAAAAVPTAGAPAASPSRTPGPSAAAAESVTTPRVQPAADGGADSGDPGSAPMASAHARMPSPSRAGTSLSPAGPLAMKPTGPGPAAAARSATLGTPALQADPAVMGQATSSQASFAPSGAPSGAPSTATGAPAGPRDRPESGTSRGSRPAPPSALPSLQGLVGVATPEAPQSAPSPAPTGPAQPFAEQLGRPVLQLAAGTPGEHVLTVRVSPEHLGPVTVQARIGSDGVHIELFSPTDAGRAAVHAALPDLRRELAGTGLGASLDLSDRSAPGQGAAAGGQAWHGGPGDGAHGRGSGPPEPRLPTVPDAPTAPTDAAWRSTRSPHPAYAATTALDVLA